MDEAPASDLTARSSPALAEPAAVAATWQLGWAAGVLGGGGVLLVCFGIVTGPLIAAVVIGVVPGVVGYFWRPVDNGRFGLLGVWAVAVAMAASVLGGAAGPLGAWCLAPLALGALIGMAAEGAVLSGAALAALLLVGLYDRTGPAPDGAFGVGVAALGLATMGGGLIAAFLIVMRGVREAQDAAAEQEASEVRLALERRLKSTELAKDRALNALSEAEAARSTAEAAAKAANANAQAKSRFLANMSHELRTPLNAIMGFSDIMRTGLFGPLSGKYGEYAELIHESGRHLTDLINDVLDMSKIEAERYALQREVFDVREPVGAALRLMRLQADDVKVQLRGILPPREVLVDADRRALKQIVLNLVSNALKFTPQGGSVTVTAQAVEGAFELVVVDTGVGIAKDDLARLGQPFEQAGDAASKAQGAGLGLSLVRAFAKLHDGEMIIESELGEGAAVTVRLPVLVEEEQPAPVKASPANDLGPATPAVGAKT